MTKRNSFKNLALSFLFLANVWTLPAISESVLPQSLESREAALQFSYNEILTLIAANHEWYKDEEIVKSVEAFFEVRDLFNREVLDFFVQQIQTTYSTLDQKVLNSHKETVVKLGKALSKYSNLTKDKNGIITPEIVLVSNSIFGFASELKIGPDVNFQTVKPSAFKKLKFAIQLYSSLAQIAGLTLFEGLQNQPYSTSTSIKKLLARLGNSLNLTVEIENAEILKTRPSADTVRFYAPTHANVVLDHIIMSHLMPSKTAILTAVPPKLPDFLLNSIDKSATFVNTKSENLKAIPKIEYLATSEGATDFWIYPEGSHSAGVLESRSLSRGFANSLIEKLVAKGIKVEIVPIVYPDNYLPFAEGLPKKVFNNRLSRSSSVRAIIGDPITNETINELASHRQLGKIDLMIRLFWERFIPNANFSILKKQFIPIRQCRSFYGAS